MAVLGIVPASPRLLSLLLLFPSPAPILLPYDPTTAQLSPCGSTAAEGALEALPVALSGGCRGINVNKRFSGLFKGLKAKGDDRFIQQVLGVRPGEGQTLLPARGPTSHAHHHPCPGGAPVRDTGYEDGSGSSAAALKATGQGGHRLPHWVKAAQRTILGVHGAFSVSWAPRRLRSGSRGSGPGRGPGLFQGLLKQARGKVVLVPESPNLRVSDETNTIHRSNLSSFPIPCTVLLCGGL
ncbi:uncharacterized protein [Macaca nemestrina]|uniref:uncharacterized protein n=1 Tax=Macaca nemestrina TaxID=9545 RepID=UPI000D31C40B|nr:uncharacterized protein LOC112426162 [Macaca nemestrina]